MISLQTIGVLLIGLLPAVICSKITCINCRSQQMTDCKRSSSISCMSLSQMNTKHSHVLPLPSAAYEGCFILFRKYVSRKAPGKGRALLEGIGLAPETIKACYSSNPLDEEAAVQDGLHKWAEGHHGYHPTWRVLLDAMEYAGIGRQHCEGLREELDQKLIGVFVCVCV